MNAERRIAVLGAGPSGLTAIKACKEEGMDVVCFERTGSVGGLWRYHDDDIDGLASVMKSTICNSSKEMSSFSDFPPPRNFPTFLHNTKMLEYIRKYAEAFELFQHIRYHMEAVSVVPTNDYEKTGRWIVRLRHTEDDVTSEEIFDGVMVCTGHHVYPNLPTYRNQDRFKGKQIHTRSLKTVSEYEDKCVLVVGFGNSAVDAAVEISNLAKEVYMSTRRGSWVFPLMGKNGMPTDMIFLRRHLDLLKGLSFDGACFYMQSVLDSKLNHAMYDLKPSHKVLSQHPTINDILPDKILCGRIIVKGNIERFEEEGVYFIGEKTMTRLDTIVYATGYQIKFPFLADDVVTVKNNEVSLYKYVFPPHLKHPSLAVIGLAQPFGSIIPVSESQSRWAALAFNRKVSLPPKEIMLKDIRLKREATSRRYVDSPRHSIQVDWIPYMDDLAMEYGVKPNLAKLLLDDPRLYWKCFTGPCMPYQYRLEGPHAWPGAREAILTYKDRMAKSMIYREPSMKKQTVQCASTNQGFLCALIIAVFLFLFAFM